MNNILTNFLKNFFILFSLFIILFFSTNFLIVQSNFEFKIFSLNSFFLFISNFFPLETSPEFIILVLKNSWITISIATVSVFFALIFAIPLSIFISRNLSFSFNFYTKMKGSAKFFRFFTRFNLVIFRSLPELIISIFFIRIFGLGEASAIYAITICYIAFFTKVFTEIIESSDIKFIHNLMNNSSNKIKIFLFSILPECGERFIAYIFFRWECAIRTSIILGIVGAGGVGQQLDLAIKMSELNEASTILLFLFVLVMITEFSCKIFIKILK